MIQWIVQACIRGEDPGTPETHRRCGAISGGVGIVLNSLLFLGKLTAGLLTSSVAMVAEAFNNLSDAATSIVTLVGFRLAGQKADADHPFGHGRIEYVTGLIVALAILLVGFELGRSALDSLLHPSGGGKTSLLALVILCASIAVKLWMFFFYRGLGTAIGSATIQATAADSLSDVASTSAVLLSALVRPFCPLPIDGLAGLLVSFLILKTGWKAAQDTLDPLLGRPMDPDLAADIDKLVLSHKNILGIHDLVYHDYGPGQAMMSFRAEVPADGDLVETHDLIDRVERELWENHHIKTVIHMDPVAQDENSAALLEQVTALARELDPALVIHDFRAVVGPLHTNLVFDLVVPYGFPMTDSQVRSELIGRIEALSSRYYPVIQVDHSYVERR